MKWARTVTAKAPQTWLTWPEKFWADLVSSVPPMWKSNWTETQRRFVDWWNRKGLLIGMWGAPDAGRALHESVAAPVVPADLDDRYCDAAFRAAENHYRLSRSSFPLDVLPIAITDLEPC